MDMWRGRARSRFVAGVVVALAGCNQRGPAPQAGGSATASVSSPAPGSSAPPAAPEPVPSPTEAEVRALVEAWAKAQSTNDFAAYEKLYAPKFTGIKRSGAFMGQYGRKEWMADRKTMVVPGLLVEASELKLRLSPVGARAEFVQHYKSPRYEDTGTKELFIVATAEGARISREEMLSSAVQAHAAAGQSVPVHAADSKGAFLTDFSGEFVPGRGGTRAVTPEWHVGYSAEAAVSDAALTAEQKAFVGRSFTTYDAKGGAPCTTTVKSLVVRSVVSAMLDTAEERSGYLGEGDDPKSLARTVFALGRNYLFGVFEPPCPGARLAVQGTSLRVFPGEESDAPRKAAVLKAIRGLSPYRDLYLSDDPRDKAGNRVPWDTSAEHVFFGVFRPERVPARTIVSIQGSMLCDVTARKITAVFDTADPERPKLRGLLEGGDYHVAVFAAFDSDGDGELEFIAGPDGFTSEIELVRRSKSGRYTREALFRVPSLICPC